MNYFVFSIAAIMLFSWTAQKKNSRVYLAVATIILALLMGLRSENVGIDTANYYREFRLIERYSLFLSVNELSFVYICRGLIAVFHEYWVLILIFSSIISVCMMMRLWDFRNDIPFALLVSFFLTFHLTAAMNIFRQYIACALVFYFSRYLEKNSIVKYLIGIVLGALFHYYAIMGLVLIPMYMLTQRNMNRRFFKLLLLLVASAPVVYIAWTEIGLQYIRYFTNATPDLGFGLFFKVALLALFYVANVMPKKNAAQSDQLKYLCYVCLLGEVFSGFGYLFIYMDRLGLIFRLFELPLFGYMMVRKTGELSTGNRFYMTMYTWPVLLLISLAAYSSIAQNSHGVFPYMPIWK